MSETKYVWEPASDNEEWDRAVAASPEGTLFSETIYLEALGRPVDRFFVRKGRVAKAAVCVVPTADASACELDDLVIYGGVMIPEEFQRSTVKRRFETFELTEFIIAELGARYRSIEVALAPQFHDLRPFLWHHYGDPDPARRFQLDLRYTSYLDLRSINDVAEPQDAACFASMETVRRYSVREAQRKGGSARRGTIDNPLIPYYQSLMAQQGEAQAEQKLERMRRIVETLVAADRAAVYEVLDREGTVVYVIVYGWDSKRAYYLFAAGHPEINHPWQGTAGHWAAFVDLATRVGVTEVDLEGVNSPKRGWFKLGFGGDLRPYYHVRKGTPA